MRVALLLGANPKTCKVDGPKVNLLKGAWRLVEQGITDTEYVLELDGRQHPSPEFVTEGQTVANIIITKRGKEETIAILAERLGDGT